MSTWAKIIPLYLAAVALGGAYGAGVFDRFGSQPAQAAAASGERIQFSSCHVGGGYNCVVDGDTIWLKGQKIRIADIDTPETHDFRCPYEKALGDRATRRLQQLLNNGTVSLRSIDRDEDRYGRKLRIVLVNGRSVGDTLVGEGLARWYGSGRQRWC
jgi:endonuclease YncB( thermonuclease family)